MDPKATLKRVCEAFQTGDHAELIDSTSDLLKWLSDGGFSPVIDKAEFCTLLRATRMFGMLKESARTFNRKAKP